MVCEEHTIPYYGSVGSLKDQIILDRGPSKEDNGSYNLPYINFSNHKDTLASTDKHGSLLWNRTVHQKIVIDYRFNFAAAVARFYAVALDEQIYSFDPSPAQRTTKLEGIAQDSEKLTSDFTVNSTSKTNCLILKGVFPMKTCDGLTLLGEIGHSHGARFWRSRASETWRRGWNGTMYVGSNLPHTVIPIGEYKVLIRALRTAGDPNNAQDYETWLSNTIKIQD